MHQALLLDLLRSLLQLAQRDVPADAGRLALGLGISPTEAARALLHLEERGLVDARRARLTLRGLAVASAAVGAAERATSSTGTVRAPEPRMHSRAA